MNNFHPIILYHKCVCRILLRKLKKYSKYTMKTCQENLWHIYMMCYFNLYGMAYAGMVTRSKSHFENCNNGPEERLSRVIAVTFWPRGRRARSPRRPRGPNVKNVYLYYRYNFCNHIRMHMCLIKLINHCSRNGMLPIQSTSLLEVVRYYHMNSRE